MYFFKTTKYILISINIFYLEHTITDQHRPTDINTGSPPVVLDIIWL